ncbi:MAG: hypothetical protein ACK514_08025 [Bacteroidota bacterium]|jgi:hypothetical protein|nr:hypothetical protein [Cytophagales bacterium]
MLKLIKLGLIGIFLNCTGNHAVSTSQTSVDVLRMAQQKLGTRTAIVDSPEGKYRLFYQTRDGTQQLNRQFKFIVIEVSTGKLLLEGTFVQGYIKWVSAKELEWMNKSKQYNSEPSITKIDISATN